MPGRGAAGVRRLDAAALDVLIARLREQDFEVLGPRVREGAIVYEPLAGAANLPAGWTDRQAPGSYRLERRDDDALFGYQVGPRSWKALLFPPQERLLEVRRDADGGLRFEPPPPAAPKRALLGVRSCELHAIAIQDRVFLGGEHADPGYAARRRALFIIVVNCGEAGATCFCASMGTGPHAERGFDLALTELLQDGRHEFVAEAGSDAGRKLLDTLPGTAAGADDRAAVAAARERAVRQMGRQLPAARAPALLMRNLEHPRWDEVAERCLSCGNCTLACPTCFCSRTEDHAELDGDAASRERLWDSCFNLEFSHLAGGGSVRETVSARYRQWLTHKIATWHEQFGSSGCVGCGRCITWCPVGIDITAEVAAIEASDGAQPA